MNPSVFRLLVTSVLSAATLLAAYSFYLQSTLPRPGDSTWQFRLDQATAIAGEITPAPDGVTINTFKYESLVNYALMGWRNPIEAEAFALVEHTLVTDVPGIELSLAWRRAQDPANVHSVRLNTPAAGSGTTFLASHPEWRGNLVELALHVTSHRPEHPVTVTHLALLPGSATNILASLSSEWRHFDTWHHRSINNMRWGANDLLVSAPVAAATWAGLTVLLLIAWNGLSRTTGAATIVAAVLVPWIAIDAIWQLKLWHQVSLTADRFAGKTAHEKQLADSDALIYRYAERLKSQVLPDSPARILLLHNSKGHNLARLKLQYYLLPHNIYNFNFLPPVDNRSSVDFVILLGNTPPETIEARGQRLYRDGNSIGVEMINRDDMGYVFRVTDMSGVPGSE